ncbi:MAG: hypothetical protein HY074_06860 [Deltaproteobacteria bacterium]|nr:hypothetical protein [Deltaproteobacteria bacterium]
MPEFISNENRSERVTDRWRRRFLPRTQTTDDVRFFDLLLGSLLHNPPALAMLAAAAVALGLFVQHTAYESRQAQANAGIVHPQAVNPSVLNLQNQRQ